MSQQNTGTKAEVRTLLQKAEETKQTNTTEAIKILYEAAQLLPHLPPDNDKRSVRNQTQDKATLDILYLSKRGNILYELKEFKEAAECYQVIKTKLPKNTQVYKAYGDSLRKQGKHDEAIKEYGVGLKVCEKDDFSKPTDSADLLNSRGLSYIGKKEYQQALTDFDSAIKINDKNPLYHCNKGHAAYGLEDKPTAMKHFEKANELVNSEQLGELTKNNIDYIKKTLGEFIKELKALEKIPLRRKDTYMAARETKFVETSLDKVSLRDDEEETKHDKGETGGNPSIQVQGDELKAAKEKLNDVQDDEQLYDYYDGLMFALSQSYLTSTVVNKDIFRLETDSTPLNIFAKVVSLLPLVGTVLSEGITSIDAFIKERSVKQAAVNVCKFASNQTQFDAIVQDAICKAILMKQDQIKELKVTEVEAILASQIQDIKDRIEELKGKADLILYGERNERPLQKLGCQTANTLVSGYIANGKIYEQYKGALLPAKKQQSLMESVLKVLEETFELKAAPPRTKKETKPVEGKKVSTDLEQKKVSTNLEQKKISTSLEQKNPREVQTDVTSEKSKVGCESCQLF